MKNINQTRQINQTGFTIIELMIALTVMSTILVISSVVLINLGAMYNKGVNQANTQNTARNIINEISSQLMLSNATPKMPAGQNVLCLGSQRYTYKINDPGAQDGEITGDPKSHALWRDTMKSSETCAPIPSGYSAPNGFAQKTPKDTLTKPGTVGTELLSLNMRLTDFSVVQAGNGAYTISVTVAYGDDDLVEKNGSRTLCGGEKARQYCAVSSLTQTVSRRGDN